ncbi:MAG: TraM recognition domain-containing protein [Dehalococcoidia bacterium]|nr:TraM recognition domain-containing protein [Dehalococcoidia bacterium]
MWRRRVEPSFAAEVVPSRALEASMSAARGMLSALAGEALSLEVAVTSAGPRWFVRAATEDGLARALSQLRVAYPQAVVEHGDGDGVDPSALMEGEHAVAMELLPVTETALPLRIDWRYERDPLAGILAVVEPSAGERVVCRLVLGAAPRREAVRIRRRREQPGRARREYDRGPSPSLVPVVAMMGLGATVLQGWRWYEAGEWALLAAVGGAALVGLPLLAAIGMRVFGSREPLPTRTVETKLGAPLVSARLNVCVFGPDPERLGALAAQVAAAYAAYDDAAGGGLRPGPARRLASRPYRRLPLLLNTGEAAALWHLPDEAGAPAGVRRTTARRLAPVPGHATQGARVGVSPVGRTSVPVHLPTPLLYRNQLMVAKTRRGKSTLLRHLAAGLMERVAAGIEDTALVVVDPHQDLAESVLASVPDALADRTIYLDFAHLERPIGLNLIDVALFPDRDRTTEHIVTMMNRLWPANWGPRMEGALRASLLCLLELNAKRARDDQFTLLDVAPFLTDGRLRERLLREVEDPALRAWWRDNYDRAGRVLQQQTANPVTSKIGRFTVTEASRLVLGQARSTFDPRAILREGGVLVVNTAVGTLGEGAAALVGATMLNLLGLLVEEQVALPAEQRRRVVELVDESSTLGAVDYPRMLSELGKYGASFVLVTQSLSKLDAIDRELVPTILANSDGLTVFQTSAEDARRLVPELGSGIEIEDLVSLDDFTCYARWWDGYARPPAFTLQVDPPPPSAPGRAEAIAGRSASRYGRPRDAVVDEITRVLAERSPTEPSEGRGQKSRAELAAAAQETAEVVALPQPTGKTERPESPNAGKPPTRGNNKRSGGQK